MNTLDLPPVTPEMIARWRAERLKGRLEQARIYAALQAFADSRGWKVSRTAFSLDQLRCNRAMRAKHSDYSTSYDDRGGFAGWLDHPEYLRDGGRPSRPVAIVSHSYHPAAQCVEQIERAGFAVEVLPLSWYNSGTTALVVTRCPVARP